MQTASERVVDPLMSGKMKLASNQPSNIRLDMFITQRNFTHLDELSHMQECTKQPRH